MDSVYEEARRRVRTKKNFYKELASFVPISLFLMFVNIFTSPNYFWFVWAVGPWGMVLLIRGLQLIVSDRTKEWERSAIRKEIRAQGKDPDIYVESPLDLDDFLSEDIETSNNEYEYRDSDLV